MDLPFDTNHKSNLGLIRHIVAVGRLGLTLHANKVLFKLTIFLGIRFRPLEYFVALLTVLLKLTLLMCKTSSS